MSQWDDSVPPNGVSRWVARHVTLLLCVWGLFGLVSVVFLVIAYESEGWSPAVWSTLTALFAVAVTISIFRRTATWVRRYDLAHGHDATTGDEEPNPSGIER